MGNGAEVKGVKGVSGEGRTLSNAAVREVAGLNGVRKTEL